jgi:high affinity sulfate transporter 1
MGYDPASLPRDVVAGVVLAGLLVPQGLGYAGIAGVEPQRGLYAAMAGTTVYALLGSSRHLVVSPTSSSAAILAAAVAPLAAGDAAVHAALAALVALGTGLLLGAGFVLRLGFVSDFIAKPVLKGFMFGLALTIIVKQAPALLGVAGGKGGFFAKAGHLVGSLGDVHATTAAVGLGALALVILLPKATRRVPPALAALVLGIVAVVALDLAARGVGVLGDVTTGLPHPSLPDIRPDDPSDLWAAALGISLIVFVESLGAGRTFAAQHGYDVVPNRELLALGAANVASGLFQGIAVGGGLSASAANERAGARSPASVLTAAAVVVLTLLFLMPLFSHLPHAVLAAIVIDAVRRMVDVRELARYVRLHSGALLHVTAAVGVLVLGVLQGMLLAVVLSIVLLLRVLSRLEIVALGRLRDTRVFLPVGTRPEVETVPGLLILRPEGPIFFANASRLRDRVRAALADEPRPRQVLLNLGASPVLGVAGHDLILQLHAELSRESVELALARVTPQAVDFLRRDGLLATLGEHRVFASQNDAVDAFEKGRAA